MYDDHDNLVKKKRLYFVGLAFPLLAAMLPQDWTSEICVEVIEDIPFDTDADVIGLGTMGHSARRAVDIAKEFKKRGKTVIVGGPMVSLVPEVAKEYCDSVMIGDADAELMTRMCRDIENGSLQPFYQKSFDCYQTFSTPLPRYDMLIKKRIGDFLPVQAGRGCPNLCKFCSIAGIYKGKHLRRPIDEVIRDIQYIKSLGFKKFLLLDDNIVVDEQYTLELCARIKPLKMKWMSQCAIQIGNKPNLLKAAAESGCYVLSLGLESINKAFMKEFNKEFNDPSQYLRIIQSINDAGIDVATEMIVGSDYDTPESLSETLEFVRKSNIVAAKFYCLTPVPGTDYYDECKEKGVLIHDDTFRYTPSAATVNTPNMTAAQMTEQYWALYKKLYTMGAILKRTLFNKRMFRHPLRTGFFFVVNMFYRYQIKRKIAPNIF
ncbi:MAG: radical SAM protein [Firmicutes bacterium]|nr:radical SAM protein [Bacillota bacterium]